MSVGRRVWINGGCAAFAKIEHGVFLSKLLNIYESIKYPFIFNCVYTYDIYYLLYILLIVYLHIQNILYTIYVTIFIIKK